RHIITRNCVLARFLKRAIGDEKRSRNLGTIKETSVRLGRFSRRADRPWRRPVPPVAARTAVATRRRSKDRRYPCRSIAVRHLARLHARDRSPRFAHGPADPYPLR